MKQEINPKVMMAVAIVVVLAIVGIGWKMFSPKHESQGERDAYLASHPGAKAAYENMHKMGAGAPIQPPPNVHIGGR